jgi:hypothetical protein
MRLQFSRAAVHLLVPPLVQPLGASAALGRPFAPLFGDALAPQLSVSSLQGGVTVGVSMRGRIPLWTRKR